MTEEIRELYIGRYPPFEFYGAAYKGEDFIPILNHYDGFEKLKRGYDKLECIVIEGKFLKRREEVPHVVVKYSVRKTDPISLAGFKVNSVIIDGNKYSTRIVMSSPYKYGWINPVGGGIDLLVYGDYNFLIVKYYMPVDHPFIALIIKEVSHPKKGDFVDRITKGINSYLDEILSDGFPPGFPPDKVLQLANGDYDQRKYLRPWFEKWEDKYPLFVWGAKIEKRKNILLSDEKWKYRYLLVHFLLNLRDIAIGV